VISAREVFWSIVTPGSDDETAADYDASSAEEAIRDIRRATSAARPTTRRHKARSSTGIRRSRTASFSTTTTCQNYHLHSELERQVATFVSHDTHARCHESLDNVTPPDVYLGRADEIIAERNRIKRMTIANRRLQHRLQAA
jgi:hypothetical protein